jgi:hypothetical protein
MCEEGYSSDLLPWNAFVIRRGIKREERADRDDMTDGDGSTGVNGVIKDDSVGDVDGRTVDVRERLDRSDCDRASRVIARSPTTAVVVVLKERDDVNGSLVLGTVGLPSSTDQRRRRPGWPLLLEGLDMGGSSDMV